MKPMQISKKQTLCEMPFVAFPRDIGGHVLSIFSVPDSGSDEKRHSVGSSTLLKSIYRKTDNSDTDKVPECSVIHPMLRKGEILDFVEKVLDTTTLSDMDAEFVISHLQKYSSILEVVLDRLAKRLHTTVKDILWNQHPNPRPEWVHDLRFYGEWWLTLRSPDTIAAQKARAMMQIREIQAYTSLLTKTARGKRQEAENQLISDLTLRLQGPLYHLTLMHFDCFDLTPSRMHVLFFGGILPLKKNLCRALVAVDKEAQDNSPAGKAPERELETLSLSNCNIGTSALMILLLALAEDNTEGCTTTLDLSCNRLNSNSLECFTALLGRTKIRRLDLRHNPLHAPRSAEFLDFLTEGCWGLTELSLCSTGLSHSQIRGLLHALPVMTNLRSLLLNHLDIPLEMAMEIYSAVRASRLQYISLTGCDVNRHPTLMQDLLACCAKNRQAEEAGNDFVSFPSFLEELFKKMEARGWTSLSELPLSSNFVPYTNNDPSLYSVPHPLKCGFA